MKNKGEKERYKHLNAVFQRILRGDKKAFLNAKAFLNGLSLQKCKEIEENNRMGKTSDLLKKIRYNKRTFHTKVGSIKARNGMDLTEAGGGKNTQKNYTKKIFMTQITTMV